MRERIIISLFAVLIPSGWLQAQTPITVPPQARFVASMDARTEYYYPVECRAWRALNPANLAWYRSEGEVPPHLRLSPDCVQDLPSESPSSTASDSSISENAANSPSSNNNSGAGETTLALPVRPPAGAQFVALSHDTARTFYPITCKAWHRMSGPFRWFSSELEARIIGLRPATECGISARYEAIASMTTTPPPMPRVSRKEPQPEPKPKPEPVQVEKPPIAWTTCTVVFVTGGGRVLCHEGFAVAFTSDHREHFAGPDMKSLRARENLARQLPPGSVIHVEILRREGTEIYGRYLSEPPPAPARRPAKPQPPYTLQQCTPLHNALLCRGRP